MDYLAEPGAATKTDTSGIRVPPPLYYVAGFVVGGTLELIVPTSWPPFGVRLAATLLAGGAWLALDGAAMALFRRAGTSMVPMNPATVLVTSGPYRLTRNPMYLGMAFLYAGIALAAGLIWALLLLPVVILVIDRLVIAREEPYLERKFGEEYREYKRRTRRWI